MDSPRYIPDLREGFRDRRDMTAFGVGWENPSFSLAVAPGLQGLDDTLTHRQVTCIASTPQ